MTLMQQFALDNCTFSSMIMMIYLLKVAIFRGNVSKISGSHSCRTPKSHRRSPIVMFGTQNSHVFLHFFWVRPARQVELRRLKEEVSVLEATWRSLMSWDGAENLSELSFSAVFFYNNSQVAPSHTTATPLSNHQSDPHFAKPSIVQVGHPRCLFSNGLRIPIDQSPYLWDMWEQVALATHLN